MLSILSLFLWLCHFLMKSRFSWGRGWAAASIRRMMRSLLVRIKQPWAWVYICMNCCGWFSSFKAFRVNMCKSVFCVVGVWQHQKNCTNISEEVGKQQPDHTWDSCFDADSFLLYSQLSVKNSFTTEAVHSRTLFWPMNKINKVHNIS